MMCHHWLSCCVSCFACLWLASFEWWSFPTRIISGLLTSSCFNSRIVYLTNFEERKINWSFRFYLLLVFHGNDNRTKSCQKAKKQMLVEGRESPALLCVIIAPCFPKLEGVQGGHKKTLLTSFFFFSWNVFFSSFSVLEKIIVQGYKALGLQYFFTAGPDEVKAWTIQVTKITEIVTL